MSGWVMHYLATLYRIVYWNDQTQDYVDYRLISIYINEMKISGLM